MFDTPHNVLFPHIFECFVDHHFLAIVDDSGQFLPLQASVSLFDLAKDELDGVVIRLIGHVVNVPEAQGLHGIFALLRSMGGEVIHEDADLVIPIILSELRQVLLELGDIH